MPKLKKLLSASQLTELNRGLVAGTVKPSELDLVNVTASMEAIIKKHGGFKKAMRTLPRSNLADTLRGMADFAEKQATTRLQKRSAKFPVAILREAASRIELAL